MKIRYRSPIEIGLFETQIEKHIEDAELKEEDATALYKELFIIRKTIMDYENSK